MRRRSELLAIAMVAAICASGLIAGDAFALPDANCRKAVGNGVRYLGSSVAKLKEKCHRLRMYGRLPAAIDCNDENTWLANGYKRGVNGLTRARKYLHKRVEVGCRNSAPPLELGYSTCPAPCGSISVANYDGVADCNACLVEGCMGDTISAAYGTPPAQTLDLVLKCQTFIGKETWNYFRNRMRVQQRCQYKKDRGLGNLYTVECDQIDDSSNPFNARIELLKARLGVRVQKECGFVDLSAELNSCGADIPSEISCLQDAVDQCTNLMFPSVYPGS